MPAGRTGRRWRALKNEVYARPDHVCCRCGQRIDYSLPYVDPETGLPDPNAKSVDHYPHSRFDRPDLAEDLGNLQPAHLRCNQSAGARASTPAYDLGITSRDW